MTPQEERLVLELQSKWGNRFDISINTYNMSFLNNNLKLVFVFQLFFFVKVIFFNFSDRIGGQELLASYLGVQIMRLRITGELT